MSVSVFFLPTIYGFSSFYRHRLTFYDWYPPSLLWLILWLIWRLGLSACWSHRGTRAWVLGLPPPFRPSVLVLGFLSAPRTLNGVAMVDRPHYHPHAPLLLTANLVFFPSVLVAPMSYEYGYGWSMNFDTPQGIDAVEYTSQAKN